MRYVTNLEHVGDPRRVGDSHAQPQEPDTTADEVEREQNNLLRKRSANEPLEPSGTGRCDEPIMGGESLPEACGCFSTAQAEQFELDSTGAAPVLLLDRESVIHFLGILEEAPGLEICVLSVISSRHTVE